MDAPKTYLITFNKNDDAELELIYETPSLCIYSSTKYSYDLENNEKSILKLLIEVSPLTDHERKICERNNHFYGKNDFSVDI